MSEPSSDQQLKTLLDEREIEAVMTRYCRALDTKDWDLLDTVFTSDAEASFGSPKRVMGREVIKTRVERALAQLDGSHHLVGNHEVVVDGDQATHQCYVQAQHVRTDAIGGPLFMVAGRYEDTLVRTTSGWRIRSRTLVVMWVEGNLKVQLPDAV